MLPKIEVKLVQIVQNCDFFCLFSKHCIMFIFHQYDFQTYISDRFQCFKCHGIFDFAYKL